MGATGASVSPGPQDVLINRQGIVRHVFRSQIDLR
jgi:hypothetical protein